MQENYEINRDAFAMVHCVQLEEKLNEAVARGEWTASQALQAMAAFRCSNALQRLIDVDVRHAIAMLEGQVH